MADLAVAVSVDWPVGSVVDGSSGSGHGGGEDGSVGHGMVSHGMVSHGVTVEPEISAGSSQKGGEAEEGLKMLLLF